MSRRQVVFACAFGGITEENAKKMTPPMMSAWLGGEGAKKDTTFAACNNGEKPPKCRRKMKNTERMQHNDHHAWRTITIQRPMHADFLGKVLEGMVLDKDSEDRDGVTAVGKLATYTQQLDMYIGIVGKDGCQAYNAMALYALYNVPAGSIMLLTKATAEGLQVDLKAEADNPTTPEKQASRCMPGGIILLSHALQHASNMTNKQHNSY